MELMEEFSNTEDLDFIDSDIEDMSNESEVDYNEFVEEEKQSQWSDSEENENLLRQEYKLKNNVIWDEKPQKEFPLQKKAKTTIKHTKKLFKTNHRIKIAKSRNTGNEHITVCVTSLNDVYVIKNLHKKRSYNIVNLMFSISDIEFLDDDRLLLVNNKCKIVKVLDINTLEHIDVKLAKLDFAKKMQVADRLYVMDESLKIYNLDNFEIEKIIYDSILDFYVSTNELVVLKKDKTIVVYDRNCYSVITAKKYVDSVFFERLFVTSKYNYVLMTKGVRVFDKNWEHVKDIFKIGFDCAIANEELIALTGNESNCLRVMKRSNNKPVKNIPSSNLSFPPIQSAFYIDQELYYVHSSFISKLDISIEQ